MKKYWIIGVGEVYLTDTKFSTKEKAIAAARLQYMTTKTAVVIMECIGIYEATGEHFRQIWEVEEEPEEVKAQATPIEDPF